MFTDSEIERKFVKELDSATEIEVYAKLPRAFLIPTPVGNYNPDWAIAFKEGSVNADEARELLDSIEMVRMTGRRGRR